MNGSPAKRPSRGHFWRFPDNICTGFRRPDMVAEVEAVALTALAKDPKARFASVHAIEQCS